jgi:hypothetical protein
MILSLQNSRRFDPTPFAVSSRSSSIISIIIVFGDGGAIYSQEDCRMGMLKCASSMTEKPSDESARARSEEVHRKFGRPYWKWHLADGIRARRRFSPMSAKF